MFTEQPRELVLKALERRVEDRREEPRDDGPVRRIDDMIRHHINTVANCYLNADDKDLIIKTLRGEME